MLDLKLATPKTWLDVVFADFDAFIVDHAACERKASATGMSFVVKYPDRSELIDPMIEFAREELEHFHIVYKLVAARGLRLASDYKDPYVNGLLAAMKGKEEQLLLDRLLVSGIVEARGCERLFMVAEALDEAREPELKRIYLELARAESRHHGLFFRLARQIFGDDLTRTRGEELLTHEAELIQRLPHRAAVH
jgi:tRNA 2-(methylsulfanyl)-N6-isopentenyladenosine37 hydroxylase